MFCIAPIHTPSIPVRRSPKYFHVSESGPSGPPVVAAVIGVALAVIGSSLKSKTHGYNSTIMMTTHVVYDLPQRGGTTVIRRLSARHAIVTSWFDGQVL